MATWVSLATDHLWRTGLAAVPLVLIVAAVSKLLPCRPGTRHLMWLMVLVWLILPPLLPGIENPWPRSQTSALEGQPNIAAPGPVQPPTPEPAQRPALRDILVPSPRSGALAASAQPDLLAQPRGAVGLPPIPSPGSAALGLHWGPFCPAADPPLEVCWGDVAGVFAHLPAPAPKRRMVESGAVLPFAPVERRKAPNETASAPATYAAPPTVRTASPPVSNEASESITGAPWPSLEGAQQWAAVAIRIRDDLALLPPLPNEVWLTGTLILLLFGVIRVARFRQLLHHAERAPADVQALVRRAGRRIGLRAAPECWMVSRCVSPMVWCAIRPRLLLPVRLWTELDHIGREAVVMHELAHLRRRDHWVLWTEGLVGSLYWWHPVVWWVRRRLRLEAEYCCDAWVTTLLPKTRRAYAQALLKTRQYLGEGQFVPAMGMGISSGRAKRFARRLTMVMTTSAKPGASIWGVGLVLLMAASGWLVSPARSCPNETAKAKPCDTKPCDAKPCDSKPCDVKKAEVEAALTARAKELTTFEKHMADRKLMTERELSTLQALTLDGRPVLSPALQVDGPGLLALQRYALAAGHGEEDQKRIEELQAQLEQLGRQLDQLHQQMHGSPRQPVMKRRGPDGRSAPRAEARPHQPAMPRTPAPPGAPAPPAPPAPPRAFVVPTPAPHGVVMPRDIRELPKPGQTWADISDEEVEWRTYKLSDGKLQDFTQFMSRSDVPILVRSKGAAIEIRATQRQHEIFNAFFQMVDPSSERAEALLVPPAFAAGFGHGAHNGALVGVGVGCGGDCNNCKCERCNEVRRRRVDAEKVRAEARAMANQVRTRAHGDAARVRAEARARAAEVRDRLRQESRRIRVEAENHEELIRSLEEQAETLREQADRMRERAERIRERAGQVRERSLNIDEDDDETGGAFQQHLDTLERNAEALNANAEELAAKAEEVAEQMEAIREGSVDLEQHADEVEQRASAIDELGDSIDGLEAGPELAMSIAELAAQIQHLAVPGIGESAEEMLSAFALPSAAQYDGMTAGQIEAAVRDAAVAIEQAEVERRLAHEAAEAEIIAAQEAAEAAAAELEAELEDVEAGDSDDEGDDDGEDEDDEGDPSDDTR